MRAAIVTKSGPGKYQQVVKVGPHRLVADATTSDGGDDAGPQPHEWVLAALGACTSITVQMYAERKGWPLESVEVSVAGDHVDGAFVLTRHVVFHGPLSDDQAAKLLEIANKCPVHKSLTGPIRVDTVVLSALEPGLGYEEEGESLAER
jgi:putative redox protein